MDQLEKQAIAAKEAKNYSGFMAQEVEQAAQLVGYNFSGVIKPVNEKDHYKISYSDFVVPLVKAVQEQQSQIVEQQKQIEELKKLVETLSSSASATTANANRTAQSDELTSLVSEDIKIYPNPGHGEFTITTNHIDAGLIEVCDSLGVKIKTIVLENNKFKYVLDLTGNVKGIYVVNIISNGKKITSKIILE